MGGQYIEPMLSTRWLGAASARAAPGGWLASPCAVCRSWDGSRLCRDCVARFAAPLPRCERCAIEVPAGIALCGACLRDPPSYDRTIAAVDYDHPWDALISAFKFHGALDLAAALAQRLVAAVEAAGGPRPDLLLPVPLGPVRLGERGYNQAWELARRAARALDCRGDARLLLRIKDTAQQLALPRARRAANVRGAFLVEPRRAGELRGRDVALVDDVLTTGATAAEIAGVLKQAGAARVQVWVVARTPKD
jgi:ComF family protein